ncbi:26S proteasome non-ATPase regulatory subunit 3 [Saguinus oedipus]|uniref:26S proteasome non-ATPase regulatory subunit 3 n=1 Tax=Saguinus oedipus TaxID=9490 RepID=A0ABQ9VIQ5_SAGOE|nr:26S proteasome non-ATPase regulatory subunit 3 [Saguinus oedipus]
MKEEEATGGGSSGEADGKTATAATEHSQRELDIITLEDIKEHVKQLEKAVSGKEPRFVLRALRMLPSTSRRLNHYVLYKAVQGFFTSNNAIRDFLLPFLEEPMDTEADLQFRPCTGKAASAPLLPEVEAYLQLLMVIFMMNSKRYKEAQKISDDLMQKISTQNCRALDLVAAKSTLRHDADGQATLLNLLLRNYLHYSLYDQAEKLLSKSVFPQQANNNEWARYLYYTGRIKAIQLEYSEARRTMTNALRKAPQHTDVGFEQTVHKLLIVVELLLGEIPDRLQFRQPSLKRSLMPYFLLTQAVRTGNLAKFNQVLDQFGEKFQADGTYTLIIWLQHNVIKTGVRMISLSYSRISLANIAQKLQLDSPEDSEFIVAKAIRDGVIEASINHEKGYVQYKEMIDIDSTQEPQLAFHQCISFCLDIHNMSVKAMRFPPKSYNKNLESAEKQHEREQQDLEFAKEMAEDDDDSFP